MALGKFSVWYYDFQIDNERRFLCISENGGLELIVELDAGSYSFTEFALKVQTAFNAIGTLGYTVTANRLDRTITIESASGTWTAKIQSGSIGADQAWTQLGFTGIVDLTGSNEYTGDTSLGQEYIPQFWLQDYVPSLNFRKASDSTQKKTATGRVEIVTFGTERFMKCNVRFSTNKAMDGRVIRNNPSGYDDVRDFLTFLITKAPVEFMEDSDVRESFETMILEKTDSDGQGIGFELKELYAQGLPEFYDTGVLTFRVVE